MRVGSFVAANYPDASHRDAATEERLCYDPLVESTTAILLRKRKLSDTSLIVSWCT